jgi:hypothetical protein
MANDEFKWFKDPNGKDGGSQLLNNTSGYQKSNGNNLRPNPPLPDFTPGFTPNYLYLSTTASSIAPNGWIGNLIENNLISLSTSDRFDFNIKTGTDGKGLASGTYSGAILSKRDTLLRFNDTSTDYFLHDQHIAGKTPFGDVTDGGAGLNNARLSSFKGSDYENQDPIVYGFEIIIDAVSSPLLNGSIDDFLKLYPDVSELQVRNTIYYDFKNQFIKLFKTKGTVSTNTEPTLLDSVVNKNNGKFMSVPFIDSNPLYDSANSPNNSLIKYFGKKAYLSHYLQKIEGLHNLSESNKPDSNKYLVDYGKDVIKISFAEDVSSTMGTLAHLYKLLYWSKPLGKGMIPENLLRFNCDIIVSECRNFNRVRKSVSFNNTDRSLEIIKDNVSRYIYSLKECQFYFDKMPHEDSIDMGNIKAYGDGLGAYEVTFDYKYVTTKFEKWVPSKNEVSGDKNTTPLFGQYVGYNNGSLWKIGNSGARASKTSTPNPLFHTVQTTDVYNKNGEVNPVILQSTSSDNPINPAGVDNQATESPVVNDNLYGTQTKTTPSTPSALDNLKNNAKKVAKNAAKNVANFAIREVNQQISTRVQLLNNTIAKIKNAIGLGSTGISGDKNVYPKPYSPISFGIYFDVRNQLFNFVGEDVASALAGFNNVINPYNNPMKPSANPLSAILQKYSSIPGVANTNANYVKNTLNDIVKKYGKGN